MEQHHVGWDNFLYRKILKQWRIYQQNYEQTQYHQHRILKHLKEFKDSSLSKKKKKKKEPPNQCVPYFNFFYFHCSSWRNVDST